MTDRTQTPPTPPIPFNFTLEGDVIVPVEVPGLMFLLFDAPSAIKHWGTIEWPNGRATPENPECFPFKVTERQHIAHDGTVMPQTVETVTFEDVVRAINEIARTEPSLFSRIIDEAQHEAAVTSAIIQFAVFGDLRYE